MAFKFQCPNGHLLEGQESESGQRCACPECGIMFIIPEAPHPQDFAQHPPDSPAANPFPEISVTSPGSTALSEMAQTSQGSELLHIPCPNGHELETPPDMLEQDVICPHCGVQFFLRARDSVEFKREREEAIARKDNTAGKKWLNWAITILVLIVLAVIILTAIVVS